MQGVLPAEIIQRRWKAESTELRYEGMQQDYLQLINLLRRNSLALEYGYVRNDIINEHLNQLEMESQDPHFGLSLQLERLFALEIWLRVFFEKKVHN